MDSVFQFKNQTLGPELIADIARILDEAAIPSVLWGNYLLTIYGIPSVVDVSILHMPSQCDQRDLTQYRELRLLPQINACIWLTKSCSRPGFLNAQAAQIAYGTKVACALLLHIPIFTSLRIFIYRYTSDPECF